MLSRGLPCNISHVTWIFLVYTLAFEKMQVTRRILHVNLWRCKSESSDWFFLVRILAYGTVRWFVFKCNLINYFLPSRTLLWNIRPRLFLRTSLTLVCTGSNTFNAWLEKNLRLDKTWVKNVIIFSECTVWNSHLISYYTLIGPCSRDCLLSLIKTRLSTNENVRSMSLASM